MPPWGAGHPPRHGQHQYVATLRGTINEPWDTMGYHAIPWDFILRPIGAGVIWSLDLAGYGYVYRIEPQRLPVCIGVPPSKEACT